MLIDKYELIKELRTKRTFVKTYGTDIGETIELTDKEIDILVDWIAHFPEAEAIKCDMDYWLDFYEIYTRRWVAEDNSLSRESFVVKRKKHNVHEND